MMKKASCIVFAGLLSGCSLFSETEPRPLYTLKANPCESIHEFSTSLAVDLPLSEASLNTARIALTPSPYQRDYAADGEWPDRLPKVLQEVFLDTFNQRWGGINVNRAGAGLQEKYLLQSEVLDFSVYYLAENHPEIHLKITFKLIDFPSRTILASHTFCEVMPVSCLTMQGIVEAFNRSLQSLLEKTIPWIEDVFLNEKHTKHNLRKKPS
jgi:cholesterol transport system auxiliary component